MCLLQEDTKAPIPSADPSISKGLDTAGTEDPETSDGGYKTGLSLAGYVVIAAASIAVVVGALVYLVVLRNKKKQNEGNAGAAGGSEDVQVGQLHYVHASSASTVPHDDYSLRSKQQMC